MFRKRENYIIVLYIVSKKMNFNSINLQAGLNLLSIVDDEISHRRELWQKSIQDLIINTLKVVKSNNPTLGLVISKLRGGENNEIVELKFTDKQSGLKHIVNSTTQDILIKGAILLFSQTFNGKILVSYKLPYLSNQTETDLQPLKTIEPDSLTQDDIEDCLSTFIVCVYNWYNSE